VRASAIARAGTRNRTRSSIAASARPESNAARFDRAALETCATSLLEAVGVDRADAALTAELLVESDLAEHGSHGLLRLPGYLAAIERGSIDPRGSPRVVVDSGATATIDGGLALGQVAARVAADEASERARRFGIACVAVRRCGHVGRLAQVAERIATGGQVGIVVANDAGAGQTVAPPGAREARLSTNPLAIAAPRASGPPFSLDMATSVVSHGKVRMRREQREEVPADWEIDGLLQFLGGYKGFGLALAVEILAGIVSGAGSSNAELQDAPDLEQGMLAIAIDIARFRPIEDVEREIDELAAYVRSAPVAAEARPLALPGERAAAAIRRNQAAGVPLARTVVEELRIAGARLGVALPTPAAPSRPR
jgi:uncharacterized oxidoreductase